MLTGVTLKKVRHDIPSQTPSLSDDLAYPQENIQERINVQHDSVRPSANRFCAVAGKQFSTNRREPTYLDSLIISDGSHSQQSERRGVIAPHCLAHRGCVPAHAHS
jgi:hypothetical protein